MPIAELLLVNPSDPPYRLHSRFGRRGLAGRPSAAQVAARARFAEMARGGGFRSNPRAGARIVGAPAQKPSVGDVADFQRMVSEAAKGKSFTSSKPSSKPSSRKASKPSSRKASKPSTSVSADKKESPVAKKSKKSKKVSKKAGKKAAPRKAGKKAAPRKAGKKARKTHAVAHTSVAHVPAVPDAPGKKRKAGRPKGAKAKAPALPKRATAEQKRLHGVLSSIYARLAKPAVKSPGKKASAQARAKYKNDKFARAIANARRSVIRGVQWPHSRKKAKFSKAQIEAARKYGLMKVNPDVSWDRVKSTMGDAWKLAPEVGGGAAALVAAMYAGQQFTESWPEAVAALPESVQPYAPSIVSLLAGVLGYVGLRMISDGPDSLAGRMAMPVLMGGALGATVNAAVVAGYAPAFKMPVGASAPAIPSAPAVSAPTPGVAMIPAASARPMLPAPASSGVSGLGATNYVAVGQADDEAEEQLDMTRQEKRARGPGEPRVEDFYEKVGDGGVLSGGIF